MISPCEKTIDFENIREQKMYKPRITPRELNAASKENFTYILEPPELEKQMVLPQS